MLHNFIEITLRNGCSPVNLLHNFRTPLPKNTSKGLLLYGWYCVFPAPIAHERVFRWLQKFNPFVPNAPFLYSLKTSGNRKVFYCLQGVEKGCLETNGLREKLLSNEHTKSTLIRSPYVVDTSKTKFRQTSTSFPPTFFDVILLDEKSMLFPRSIFQCNLDDRKIHFIFMHFFQCNFDDRKINVISTYFSWCNFNGQKIHNISTYFFWCNFDGQKIDFVSTYFLQCIFNGRKIHVISMYFFRCKFDGRNIHVVSRYYFWCNFDGRKIYVVFTCCFRCTLSGRNIHVVFIYFFDVIWMGKNSTPFLARCKLMKTFEEVFLC